MLDGCRYLVPDAARTHAPEGRSAKDDARGSIQRLRPHRMDLPQCAAHRWAGHVSIVTGIAANGQCLFPRVDSLMSAEGRRAGWFVGHGAPPPFVPRPGTLEGEHDIRPGWR